jgi:hypothetical protein
MHFTSKHAEVDHGTLCAESDVWFAERRLSACSPIRLSRVLLQWLEQKRILLYAVYWSKSESELRMNLKQITNKFNEAYKKV